MLRNSIQMVYISCHQKLRLSDLRFIYHLIMYIEQRDIRAQINLQETFRLTQVFETKKSCTVLNQNEKYKDGCPVTWAKASDLLELSLSISSAIEDAQSTVFAVAVTSWPARPERGGGRTAVVSFTSRLKDAQPALGETAGRWPRTDQALGGQPPLQKWFSYPLSPKYILQLKKRIIMHNSEGRSILYACALPKFSAPGEKDKL